MIALITDFGTNDPYVGQVKARIAEFAPGQDVVDLLHQAPAYNAHAGAHLVAALADGLPPGTVFVCVVDPGVGTLRDGVVLTAGGHWFVGPDNGLLSVVAGRNIDSKVWRIKWQPEDASTTFHGRDVFAVIAALIAKGAFPADKLTEKSGLSVEFGAGDLNQVVYIDHFGNAWTGIRSASVPAGSRLFVKENGFQYAETFGFVAKGEGFWFGNSVGLLELAVNRGHAASQMRINVGDEVQIQMPN